MDRRNILTRNANHPTHVNNRRAIAIAMALVTTLSSSPLLGQEQGHAAHAQESAGLRAQHQRADGRGEAGRRRGAAGLAVLRPPRQR